MMTEPRGRAKTPPEGVTIQPWLKEVTSTYGLTDLAARRFSDLEACRLIVSTTDGIYRVAHGALRAVRLLGAQDEAFTALIGTPAGALACITRQGRLTLIDPEGIVSCMRHVSGSAWHLAYAQWQGRDCFFVSGLQREVRMLDATGELMFRLETPGPMLSLATQMIDGDLYLAGGARDRQQVYVWNLSRILAGHAEPPGILRGGTRPAYMARFIALNGRPWLVHSCWDGHVYGYPSPWRAGQSLAPAIIFQGTVPLYALEPVLVRGRPYLLGGAEDGRLLAWALGDGGMCLHRPGLEIAKLSASIRRLTSATVAGQVMLWAGCADGRLAALQLPRVAPALAATSARVGRGPVGGIGFTWPVEDEMVA
jgi:hypothetical protein